MKGQNVDKEVTLLFHNVYGLKVCRLGNGALFVNVWEATGMLGYHTETIYDAFRDPDTGKSRIKCRRINGKLSVPIAHVTTYWAYQAEQGNLMSTALMRELTQKSLEDRAREAFDCPALPPAKLGVLESMEERLKTLERRVRELEVCNVL
jgi:hypothetical protein